MGIVRRRYAEHEKIGCVEARKWPESMYVLAKRSVSSNSRPACTR